LLQREKRVDGLFLSSGIVPDANTTMEKMLVTVERLRLKEGYTLPRDKTPKQAWAENNLHEPVEVNRATREQLLRIPGIGPKSADNIIVARRETRLRDLSQLEALGVTVGWATPYVLLDGRCTLEQLRLW
jgi:predicted DNA-binding helix-hairpin-helix protein